MNEEVSIVNVNNTELRNFYLWASSILHGLFGTFYFLFSLKSFYHRAYFDFTCNIVSAFLLFFVIYKGWVGKKNVIRFLIYAFIFSEFYLSSYFGYYSGVYLSYLSLLIILPFAFDIHEERKEILFLFMLVFVLISIHFLTDFKLFYNPAVTIEIQKDIFPTQIIALLITIMIFTFLLFKYNQVIQKVYTHSNAQDNYKLLDNPISAKTLEDLNHLAMTNNNTFIIKFNETFPSFYQKLQHHYPDLTKGELEVCCYIKLNYSTKEIAIATNNSIRSVDSKKYRIRKKLNLNTSENLYEYLILTESLSKP